MDYTPYDFHVVMQIKCLIFLYLPMLAADICEHTHTKGRANWWLSALSKNGYCLLK